MDDREKTAPAATAHDEIRTEPRDVHHIDGTIFSEKVPTKHDDALDFLRSTGDNNFTYTDKEATKVRWKIDLYLMPLVCLTLTRAHPRPQLMYMAEVVARYFHAQLFRQGNLVKCVRLWAEARYTPSKEPV